ncbi:MAG TPA: cellulase family glycosylhydrolase [Gemmatimonadales bacterium]|nr:cellulase family glycosylhydrolase [Gemmatimonadales bacterium]
MIARTCHVLRLGFSIAAVACIACGHPAVEQPQPLTAVPASRLALLARSANLTRWPGPAGYASPAAAGPGLSAAEVAKIRGLGFTAVRLVIHLGRLFRPSEPDSLGQPMLAELDRALDLLLAQDLGVIIDPHPSARDRRIETDSTYADAFVRFWAVLARHLSRRDPDRVFLEVMNEPVFKGHTSQWPPLQRQLLASMRREAPRHTLIAAGTWWSSIDGLLRLTPVADRNVIYTFHFYEPFNFTHQGEAWAEPPAGKLRGVPYPGDGPGCLAAAHAQPDSTAARAVRRYCAHGWNAAAIERRLGAAAAWGREHGVPLFLGEFGASHKAAPPEARVAWLHDVRVAAERLGIGWALWSFDDRFGLGAKRGPGGGFVVDSGVVRALGLRPDSVLVSRAR